MSHHTIRTIHTFVLIAQHKRENSYICMLLVPLLLKVFQDHVWEKEHVLIITEFRMTEVPLPVLVTALNGSTDVLPILVLLVE